MDLVPINTSQNEKFSSHGFSPKIVDNMHNIDKTSQMENFSANENKFTFSDTNSIKMTNKFDEIKKGISSKIWKYTNRITKDIIDSVAFDNKDYKADNDHKLCNF